MPTTFCDIATEARQLLLEKTELSLKEKIGYLSKEEILKRCRCLVQGFIYTYYLDNVPIVQVDYELKIAE
jgi:hypothetical protein